MVPGQQLTAALRVVEDRGFAGAEAGVAHGVGGGSALLRRTGTDMCNARTRCPSSPAPSSSPRSRWRWRYDLGALVDRPVARARRPARSPSRCCQPGPPARAWRNRSASWCQWRYSAGPSRWPSRSTPTPRLLRPHRVTWLIPAIGARYELGLDGIGLVLVLLTTALLPLLLLAGWRRTGADPDGDSDDSGADPSIYVALHPGRTGDGAAELHRHRHPALLHRVRGDAHPDVLPHRRMGSARPNSAPAQP